MRSLVIARGRAATHDVLRAPADRSALRLNVCLADDEGDRTQPVRDVTYRKAMFETKGLNW